MLFPDEQELVVTPNSNIALTGFREIESNHSGAWRWAIGPSQVVSFRSKAKFCRVHYSIFIPIAGTSVTIRHCGVRCLELQASEPDSTFKGFFEITVESDQKQDLQFFFERNPSVHCHPVDPSLSFTIQRLLLVSSNSGTAFVMDQQMLQMMRTVLIVAPTWSPDVPPMGAAYLSATLRKAGILTSVFDYNITAWHALKDIRIENEEDLWSNSNARFFRDPALFESAILPYLRPSMEKLVDEICALKPKVVGFTVFYPSLPCMEAIAKACKERLPDAKIVCGGPEMGGADLNYRQGVVASSIMDAAVVGEGEGTIIELIARWAQCQSLDGCKGIIHKLKCGLPVVEAARPQLPFETLSFPDYSDFELSRYRVSSALPLMMSRGCVARCAFCSETRFWQKFRSEMAERTFEQIRLLIGKYNINKFYFNDSLINGNFNAIEKLAELIIASGLKFKWIGQARIDKRMTSNLLQKISQSGCEFLSYGFESGSQKVVDSMDKRATVETAQQVIRDTHEAGIFTGLNVIVGFPGEEEEDFKLTMDFVRNNLPYIGQVGLNEMNVFVGVPVGDDPKRFGIDESFNSGGFWQTIDGRNTPAVRRDRFRRISELVAEHGIKRGLGSSSM